MINTLSSTTLLLTVPARKTSVVCRQRNGDRAASEASRLIISERVDVRIVLSRGHIIERQVCRLAAKKLWCTDLGHDERPVVV